MDKWGLYAYDPYPKYGRLAQEKSYIATQQIEIDKKNGLNYPSGKTLAGNDPANE